MTQARPTSPGGRGGASGATAPPASRLPLFTRRTSRVLIGAALTAATATGGIFVAGSASAGTPPTGPGNIEAFPNRDMVAIEGYAAQAGQTAKIEVLRGGQVVGFGTGTVDSTGFLEMNHDAASCFTDVTPNIGAGDEVRVSFNNHPLVDSMIVGGAEVTDVTPEGTNAVTITGTYDASDPNFNLDRFNVEVVNPAMRDAPSAIGERAIGWSPNEAPAATQGYTVTGTAADGTFSVTFGGLSAHDQQLVFEGEKVALSWMADATTVEQQLGLTLAEFGQPDGGAPGCPPGPDQAGAPSSSYSVVWNGDGSEATVTWAKAQPVAGAAAVDGYSVVALDGTTQRQEGYRVGADATQVVVDGLTGDALYDIEVRSMVDEQMSAPFGLAGTIAPPNEDGTADTTVAAPTSTPDVSTGTTTAPVRTSTVTLSAAEGAIHYTVDGTPATTTNADGTVVPSATATLYSAPIQITGTTTVNAVAIDAAGNVSSTLSGVVTPAPAAAAVPPEGLAITNSTGSGPNNDAGTVSLAWNPVTDATEYRVRTYLRTDANNTNTLQGERDLVVNGTTATVTGLPKSEPGTRWVFRVQSKTPAAATYSDLSVAKNIVLPGDEIGATADWRAGDELQIRGSGSVPGATITVHRPNANGGPGTQLTAYPTATVGALEAPENSGPFEIVLDPAPATNPGTLVLKSSLGDWVSVTVETR